MNRTALERFQGKNVKLVITNGFVLWGTIDELYDDSLLFSTIQKTGLIAFSRIQEVIPI